MKFLKTFTYEENVPVSMVPSNRGTVEDETVWTGRDSVPYLVRHFWSGGESDVHWLQDHCKFQ